MPKVLPFLKWAGGKRWLASNYLNYFPKKYDRYIEPFLGSGAVFFALNPERAILSDLNSELILAYEAIRDDWQTVLSLLEEHQRRHCPDHYYRVRSTKLDNPYERAARLIYLNRTCWNALYRVNLRGQFNVPIGSKTSVLLDTDDFAEVSRRLHNAELLCADFEEVLSSAGARDFVYMDPPYPPLNGTSYFTHYTPDRFGQGDQRRVAEVVHRLHALGAKFLVSNADTPLIRELYSPYNCTALSVTRYATCGAHKHKVSELVVTNYEAERPAQSSLI